ncbi:MAG: nuclear transport factor 2 family protein [Chloracidobacterium sp.]|jgi:ketosteroid isomerase-like protein|nr:nuclear transport factor 2 family protein [Chloracidobacterium sp.]
MTRKDFNRLLMAALAVVIGAGAIAFSLNETVSAQTDEVKAVTDVMTREALAIEQGDLAALDKIWANSDDVTVFESGHANYGWTDYRNTHLAPELKEFKNTKYSFSDMKVKVDGKTAWATFKYSLAAEMGTRKVESGGLGTAVLEKREGKWRIVHWHSSAPRRAPAPAASPTPKA